MMPRCCRFYVYMRRLGSSRREALAWAWANLRARRTEPHKPATNVVTGEPGPPINFGGQAAMSTEPKGELARYAFGYSDKKPGPAFWIIHAAMIVFLLFALFGCAATYRIEQPLSPVTGDRLPACDTRNNKCERT